MNLYDYDGRPLVGDLNDPLLERLRALYGETIAIIGTDATNRPKMAAQPRTRPLGDAFSNGRG